MVKLYRVATVKATGKKYLVNYLDFRTNKVACLGEVTKAEGLRTWHDTYKLFHLSEVELSKEQPKDQTLIDSLFAQGLESLREKGHGVDVKKTAKGNVVATVHLTMNPKP